MNGHCCLLIFFSCSLSCMHVCMCVCWRDYCDDLQTLVHVNSIFVVILRCNDDNDNHVLFQKQKVDWICRHYVLFMKLYDVRNKRIWNLEKVCVLCRFLSSFFWYFVSQHVVSPLLLSFQLQAELWVGDCVGCTASALIEFIDPYFFAFSFTFLLSALRSILRMSAMCLDLSCHHSMDS